MAFIGAKLALFIGADLLVILRDDLPDIPYPAHWDFPGGGREGGESAADCVLRETQEEVGLHLSAADLVWRRRYVTGADPVWFFAAHLGEEAARLVRLGDEGQGWRLMTPQDYCAHDRAIPHFAQRLADYLASTEFMTR